MRLKLDMYRTLTLPGSIMIEVQSNSDPTLLDVFTDLKNSEGEIYLDNYNYFWTGDHSMYRDAETNVLYLELSVVLDSENEELV